MASDCKSPRKKKGKGGKERKWENKTSRKAGRKVKRQVDRQEIWHSGIKRSRKKGSQTSFVGLSFSSDSKSSVDPPLVLVQDLQGPLPHPKTALNDSDLEWHLVTVASFHTSKSAIGLPTILLLPRTTALEPRICAPDRLIKSRHPSGVHGTMQSTSPRAIECEIV